ncbi:MAG: amidase family protein, partial [Candidatus Nanoarchaeia archaeon]
NTKYAIADYYVIATAEASANLARFDGIRYGRRVAGKDLLATYFKTRGAGFGAEVKRRIILGTFVLSSGYYDAYYLRAQKLRTLIRQDFIEAFKKCDALLSPVSPFPAFKFGEKADPLQMYLADIFTISVNLAGICAVSLPADLHPTIGMPVGVQFIGPHFGEKTILRISQIFESYRSRQEFFPSLCTSGGSKI